MGRPRKIKLDSMNQVHGKKETFKPTTLDQIWGDTGMSKYRTFDEATYMKELNAMNKSDLQSHAMKLGIMAIDDGDRLKKRLLQEFRNHVISYQIPAKPLNQTTKVSDEAMKILAEGR
jgi:hypothetical protein